MRTIVTRPTWFTPFCLLFGEEAMTPEECKNKSFRVTAESALIEESVSEDALEEVRMQAIENMARYQEETRKWRDKKVSLKEFSPGDLVLRRLTNTSAVGKLQSRWDRPFLVKRSLRPGSYRLATAEGDELPNTWNADNLHKFYV